MSLLAARKGYLRDLKDFDERGLEPGESIDDLNCAAALVQPFVYSMGLLKTPGFAKKGLEATEAKIRALVEQSSGGDWRLAVSFPRRASSRDLASSTGV